MQVVLGTGQKDSDSCRPNAPCLALPDGKII